jgi:hypothetical protein
MPDDPIWTYPAQANVGGAGPPGAHSSDPGDTVGWLWEEPADIAQGHISLRLILGNPNASTDPWAGASVYLSYDDVTYALMARTSQRSIIGHLDVALPAGAGTWQPAATCDIDITVSPGTLVDTDAAGAQAGVNLCLIGDEVCSFVDAAPIAGGYTLTGFQRGWFGTAVVLHNIGDRFAMLSPLQARVDMPISAKGQTWHWKAPSLNIGRVEQDMAGIAPTHLTFDGKGLGATLLNTGLHLLDTNASHDLIIAPGSDLTADRILTLTTDDAARTFSLLGDLTVESASAINQDLTSDAAPTFAGETLNGNLLFGSGADRTIRQNTADGSDNRAVYLMGGGAEGSGRGSEVVVIGEDYGSNVSGSLLLAASAGADAGTMSGMIRFYPAYTLRWLMDRSGNLMPVGAGTLNIGDGSNYIADLSYKTLTDRGCLGSFDGGVEMQDGSILSDMAALQAIRVDPTKETVYGVPRLDYATMPKAVYKPVPIATEDVYEPDPSWMPGMAGEAPMILRWLKGQKMGEDGAEMTALLSIMLGAVKELEVRLATAESKLAEAKA